MLSLLAESWTCVSRYVQLGSIKALQREEYVMFFVFVMYTNLVAWMNVVAHVDTNLMLPSEVRQLTPESIKSRTYGSKLVLVVEQSMIATQWGCKTCLLLMYSKLTFGLKQQVAVKIVAVYVAMTFVIMEILYFGVWCKPFHEYWKVPVDNGRYYKVDALAGSAICHIRDEHRLMVDDRKLALCCLFGLGIFVILCAVLNKYYSFKQPFSPMWTFWYIREASTAVLVANIPMCWPLVRRLFNLRSFHPSSGRATSSNTNRNTTVTGLQSHKGTKFSRSNGTDGNSTVKDVSWWERNPAIRLGKSESEENIVALGGGKPIPLEIWQDRQFDVVHDKDSETEIEGSGTMSALRILVPMKRVIDYAVKVRVNKAQTGVETAGVKHSSNPFDDLSIEESVRIREKKRAPGGVEDIVAFTCGPTKAQEVLRTAMAIGADRAIHVETAEGEEIEPLTIAKLLKQVVEKEKSNFVILGKQSIDDDAGQTGQMLAGLLGWSQATQASEIKFLEGDKVEVIKEVDGGTETVRGRLPMIVTTDLRLNEPRFATLPNIMKAKKKKIDKMTLKDFGLDAQKRLKTVKVMDPPPREGGAKVEDVDGLIAKLKELKAL
ncbi:hypothetical protein B7463_g1477, partial [Scytalidium lignicola]